LHILCGLFGHKHKIMLGTRSKSSDHSKYCFRADYKCSRCSDKVNKELPHNFVESGNVEDWVLLENHSVLRLSPKISRRGKYEISTFCYNCGLAGKPIIANREIDW